MNQIRNNQVGPGPVNTGTNLSVPPQGASSPPQESGQPGAQQVGSNNSPAPPSQSHLPRPLITYVPGMNNRRYSYQFDDQSEKENPCRCCCGLAASVKGFVILNLVYLFLKCFFFHPTGKSGKPVAWYVVNIIVTIVTIPIRNHFKSGFFFIPPGDQSCFVVPVPPIYFLSTFVALTVVVIVIYLMDVITTIMLMNVIFYEPELHTKILFCNVFMWYNFFYPGIIFHLAVYIGARSESCDTNWTLPYWIIGFIILIAWVVCSALVARAYRNGIRRARILEEQGRVGGTEMSTVGVNTEGTGGRPLEEAPGGSRMNSEENIAVNWILL